MRRKNGTGAINADGYIVHTVNYKQEYEHIRIAESVVGRKLPKPIQVHHVDGNQANNANGNLVVCPDQKYHRLLHRRTDALNSCGNASFIKCRHCGQYDDPAAMKMEGSRSMSHTACRSKYRKRRRAQGRNA